MPGLIYAVDSSPVTEEISSGDQHGRFILSRGLIHSVDSSPVTEEISFGDQHGIHPLRGFILCRGPIRVADSKQPVPEGSHKLTQGSALR